MKAKVVLLLIVFCQLVVAQETLQKEKDTITLWKLFKTEPTLKGVVLGVHGARETMFEIGYFQYLWVEELESKIPIVGGMGYSLSTEHYINEDYVIAPKATAWINLFYANIGMSLPWYFDTEGNNSFRVRPEIGIGSGDFKLTYALNMAITNKDMPNVSKHMVSAIYFLNFDREAGKNKRKW
ncbi:MAG: hypothetical protein AAF611_10420 [Bacteroidota bacterium]